MVKLGKRQITRISQPSLTHCSNMRACLVSLDAPYAPQRGEKSTASSTRSPFSRIENVSYNIYKYTKDVLQIFYSASRALNKVRRRHFPSVRPFQSGCIKRSVISSSLGFNYGVRYKSSRRGWASAVREICQTHEKSAAAEYVRA